MVSLFVTQSNKMKLEIKKQQNFLIKSKTQMNDNVSVLLRNSKRAANVIYAIT